MKILTTAVVVITAVAFCHNSTAEDNTLTKEQKAAGWKMLFDGKTLEGWSIKSGFATYKVEDGAIVGTTKAKSPNTFLCSKESFADFELTFDVKFDQF